MVWRIIFNWIIDILVVILWVWILFKPSLLAEFLWHCSSRRVGVLPHYCQVGIESRSSLTLLSHSVWTVFFITAGCGRSSDSPSAFAGNFLAGDGWSASLLPPTWLPLIQGRWGNLITAGWKSWLSAMPALKAPQWEYREWSEASSLPAGCGLLGHVLCTVTTCRDFCYCPVGMKVLTPSLAIAGMQGLWPMVYLVYLLL